MKRGAIFTAVIFALTGALAYGLQVLDRDATWIAPLSTAARINPLAGRIDTVSGGRRLYQQRCATCHGEDGHGSSKAPDLTQPAVQAQNDGAIFWKISSGNTRQGMPTFSFLPEPQRWQTVLYLRALAAHTPSE
jgi:mono/diheme cytochrome c family protein